MNHDENNNSNASTTNETARRHGVKPPTHSLTYSLTDGNSTTQNNNNADGISRCGIPNS